MLVLPNAWDAGERPSDRGLRRRQSRPPAPGSRGRAVIPTATRLPPRVLARRGRARSRASSLVPLTVDAEGGYSTRAGARVAETIARLIDAARRRDQHRGRRPAAGASCAKIAAVRTRTPPAPGVDLFVNARTDVFLRGLVPPEASVRRRSRALAGIATPDATASSSRPRAIRRISARSSPGPRR